MDRDSPENDPWSVILPLRNEVELQLRAFIESRAREVRVKSGPSEELVEAVLSLSMRPAKRIRPLAAAAAYCTASGERPDARCVKLGVAFELLQSFLLIHDDWMDGDRERRGGPSAHAWFAQKYRSEHLGASLGVLAGDFAAAAAWHAFSECDWPKETVARAQRAFVDMQYEVFLGQHLDVTHDPDVDRMHDLKTTSYTARGPILLGALLHPHVSESELQTLAAFAHPMGLAFQVRDDYLGVFGDSDKLGKPVGADLKEGKVNSVYIAAQSLLGPTALSGIFGNTAATDESLRGAIADMKQAGIAAFLDDRIESLRSQAMAALARSFSEGRSAPLVALLDRVTERDR